MHTAESGTSFRLPTVPGRRSRPSRWRAAGARPSCVSGASGRASAKCLLRALVGTLLASTQEGTLPDSFFNGPNDRLWCYDRETEQIKRVK